MTEKLNGRERNGRAWIGLVALAALWILLGWPTFRGLAGVYASNADYSHGFLVPFFSIFMAYENRKSWRFSRDGGGLAVLLAVAGCLIVVFGEWHALALGRGSLIETALNALGLILCLAAICAATGGLASRRAWLFPVLFLLLAMPLPQAVALRITVPLRDVVSAASTRMLGFLGVQVLRQGNILHLNNISLGVADACSGIRSLLSLLALAAALAYLIRTGILRGVVLFVLAAPVSVAGNVFRVVVTAILAQNFGLEFTSGWRHETVGWVSFGLGLGALVFLAWVLLKIGRRRAPKGEPAPRDAASETPPASRSRPAVVGPIVVGAILLLSEGATAFIGRHYAPFQVRRYLKADRQPFAHFPRQVEDYVAANDEELSKWEAGMIRPSDRLVRVYEDPGGRRITLTILYWLPQLALRSNMAEGPHSPDICFPSFGWAPESRFDRTVEETDVPGGRFEVRLFRQQGQAVVVLFGYRGGKDAIPASGRIEALLDSWKEPEPIGSFYYYTIVTRATPTPEAAYEAAHDFLQAIAPYLSEHGLVDEAAPAEPGGGKERP